MGESAIGVIRVSGPAELAVVSRVLKFAAPPDDALLNRIFSTVRLGK